MGKKTDDSESGYEEEIVFHVKSTSNLEIDRDCELSLRIEKVLRKHYKDLSPKEVNQIQKLETFVFPSRVEHLLGKMVIYKPILFYKIDAINADEKASTHTWSDWSSETSDDREVNVEMS